jgi:hypothetical protein
MKPTQLLLRCYAEKVGNQWQAFCLYLSLAAQGDTFAEVKDKLDAMVVEYVYDAPGDDRDYAEQLLTRRAPLRDWIKYYWYSVLSRAGAIHEEGRRLFTLEPAPRYRHA